MAIKAGVGVREFWDLTPWENMQMIAAYWEKFADYKFLVAWHLAPLLQSWGNSDVTVNKLLGNATTQNDALLEKLAAMNVRIGDG